MTQVVPGDAVAPGVSTPSAAAPSVPVLALQCLTHPVVLVRAHAGAEVLGASRGAHEMGLVHDRRVSGALATPIVADAIRRATDEQRSGTYSLSLPAAAAQPARHLEVTVDALGDALVLVQVEDRSSAQRVDMTRRDFIANVSHELKTPIGGVLLLAEAIEGAADDEEAVRHFSQRMHEEALRLTDMVNQLIELSRLQSEAPLRHAELVDMEEVVDDALARCQLPASRKRITLLTTGEAGGLVYGEELNLIDAVANLVLNAIAYSDHNSRVTISLRRRTEPDGNVIEVAVTDRGMGIKPEDLDRIFERFYRVDYGRSRAHGGTGLGLSLVRHVAESHGGSVRVSSVFGEGSTFTLRLPEYSPSTDAAPSTPAKDSAGQHTSSTRTVGQEED